MSNNQPITFATALVLAPSVTMPGHAGFQQLIMSLGEEEYAHSKVMAAIRVDDIKRLFGENVPAVFYTYNNPTVEISDGSRQNLSYVSLRKAFDPNTTEEEVFADISVITDQIADKIIVGGLYEFMNDFFIEHDNMNFEVPSLRLKLLVPPAQLAEKQPHVLEHFAAVDYEGWKDTPVKYTFDFNMLHWTKHPVEPEAIVEKRRLHLKDIPLDNRAGRRLVRASIEENREKLTNMFIKSGAQTTFNEWMTDRQGVMMKVLDELEKIDALSDEDYVKALVAFKKGEAQAYHSQQVKDGKTTLHLFDWTLENFGVEFEQLGLKEAQAEIVNLDEPTESDEGQDQDDEAPAAVFVVQFDGTIVEDHFPMIGPESPFAIATMRRLIEKGHTIIVATKRERLDLDLVFDFFANAEVPIVGTISTFPSSGIIKPDDMWFNDELEIDELPTEDIEVDYLIDHRQFGSPMVQISGRAERDSTFYWGDLIGHMKDLGYLTQEDVTEISGSMAEDQ